MTTLSIVAVGWVVLGILSWFMQVEYFRRRSTREYWKRRGRRDARVLATGCSLLGPLNFLMAVMFWLDMRPCSKEYQESKVKTG